MKLKHAGTNHFYKVVIPLKKRHRRIIECYGPKKFDPLLAIYVSGIVDYVPGITLFYQLNKITQARKGTAGIFGFTNFARAYEFAVANRRMIILECKANGLKKVFHVRSIHNLYSIEDCRLAPEATRKQTIEQLNRMPVSFGSLAPVGTYAAWQVEPIKVHFVPLIADRSLL